MTRHHKQFTATRDDAGTRLGTFLKEKCKNRFSGKKIQEALHQGICRVNGKLERFASYRLQKGDKISLDVERLNMQRSGSVNSKIVYEDEDLLCVDKPAGIACTPAAFAPHLLVHRLDKETTGCLLLAKKKRVQHALEKAFAERAVGKVYLALVYGVPQKNTWTIKNALGPKHDFDGQTIYGAVTHGKEAVTSFEVIERFSKYTLIKCVPATGRTHQIRVHLAGIGFPIVGDVLYGREHRIPSGVVHHLLHAHVVQCTHPVTKKTVRCTSPLPECFRTFLKSLVQ